MPTCCCTATGAKYCVLTTIFRAQRRWHWRIYGACTLANLAFSQLRIMFLGAGSAATGIADLLVQALVEQG